MEESKQKLGLLVVEDLLVSLALARPYDWMVFQKIFLISTFLSSTYPFVCQITITSNKSRQKQNFTASTSEFFTIYFRTEHVFQVFQKQGKTKNQRRIKYRIGKISQPLSAQLVSQVREAVEQKNLVIVQGMPTGYVYLFRLLLFFSYFVSILASHFVLLLFTFQQAILNS